ncbi:hypothetical protein B296_00006383 [Ensete ventricosum]|uniref:Uncharacterized protein n=1 Tax=Ensete ventricosum TaxID=4639 RepID=A0A426Z2K6_ENSVE|nr:hypothetical protein B296_00006383 [Ensete ventricosum]
MEQLGDAGTINSSLTHSRPVEPRGTSVTVCPGPAPCSKKDSHRTTPARTAPLRRPLALCSLATLAHRLEKDLAVVVVLPLCTSLALADSSGPDPSATTLLLPLQLFLLSFFDSFHFSSMSKLKDTAKEQAKAFAKKLKRKGSAAYYVHEQHMYVYVRKDGCAGESTVNNRMLQMRGEERRGEESRETRHSQAVRLQLSGQGHVDEPSTHEGCLAALAYCSRNEAKYVTTSERTANSSSDGEEQFPGESP